MSNVVSLNEVRDQQKAEKLEKLKVIDPKLNPHISPFDLHNIAVEVVKAFFEDIKKATSPDDVVATHLAIRGLIKNTVKGYRALHPEKPEVPEDFYDAGVHFVAAFLLDHPYSSVVEGAAVFMSACSGTIRCYEEAIADPIVMGDNVVAFRT